MKLWPVTKLDKKKHGNVKKICAKFLMSVDCEVIVNFQFMANLEQFGSRILDTWSVNLTFSLIVSFCFTKTENITRKSLTRFSYYCFEQRYYFCQKKCWHQENQGGLSIKRFICWNYICVYTCVPNFKFLA